jgi:hypothetical protein
LEHTSLISPTTLPWNSSLLSSSDTNSAKVTTPESLISAPNLPEAVIACVSSAVVSVVSEAFGWQEKPPKRSSRYKSKSFSYVGFFYKTI